jgi:hypothetical protein
MDDLKRPTRSLTESLWNVFVTAALFSGCVTANATDANLLPHGDFATANDVSAWTLPPPIWGYTLSTNWSSTDADSDALSGSFAVFTNGAEIWSQCFAITPGASFSYGGMSKASIKDNGSFAAFVCQSFTDTACKQGAGDLSFSQFQLVLNTWYPSFSVTGTLPADAASAQCDLALIDFSNAESILFDDLYFTSADPPIFSTDFETSASPSTFSQ